MQLPPLIGAILEKRYKRFLADVTTEDNTKMTVFCPNPGSMKSCWQAGWKILLSKSDNPKRKYPYTWELVHNGICWIGINTHRTNKIALEAITNGQIPELASYSQVRTEVPYGRNSRIDILLQNDQQLCYVEVKNVTLLENGNYQFPDAVTARGTKHLNELIEQKKQGHRAVMLYVIQRNDGKLFQPATHIDPTYAQTMKKAAKAGVEFFAYETQISPQSIEISKSIVVQL